MLECRLRRALNRANYRLAPSRSAFGVCSASHPVNALQWRSLVRWRHVETVSRIPHTRARIVRADEMLGVLVRRGIGALRLLRSWREMRPLEIGPLFLPLSLIVDSSRLPLRAFSHKIVGIPLSLTEHEEEVETSVTIDLCRTKSRKCSSGFKGVQMRLTCLRR